MADAPRPRRFVGRRAAAEQAAGTDGAAPGDALVAPRLAASKRFVKQQVPDDILHDEALNEATAVLPPNYNFEVHKVVARIRQLGAKRVALQFPEGLLMYACVMADILESHASVDHAFVMGDVTYGACCVDDFSAAALRADLLVHFGHSCLVPVDVTKVPCMYVFVDIGVDVAHLVATVRAHFPAGAALALAGTIQFGSSLQVARAQLAGKDTAEVPQAARAQLAGDYPSLAVPQARPLSPGEVLGCTAPVLPAGETDAIVFLADGRFHLEAIMIANPSVPAFRYDPYAREMTAEHYDQVGMRAARRAAVEAAAPARQWGIVLGTLGRQGNPRIVAHLQTVLSRRGCSHMTVLLSEVLPSKLALFTGIDAWVQVACPRLSIDWGEAFLTPTLTPYEALIALGEVPPWWASESPTEGELAHKLAAASATSAEQQSVPCQLAAAGRAAADPGCTCGQATAHCSGIASRDKDQGAAAAAAAAETRQGGADHAPTWYQPPDATADGETGVPSLQLGNVCAAAAGNDDRAQRPQVLGAAAAERAAQRAQRQQVDPYPMDYYARDGGAWSSYYAPKQAQGGAAKLVAMRAARAAAAAAVASMALAC